MAGSIVDVTSHTQTSWVTSHPITLPECQPKDHLVIWWGLDGLGGDVTGPGGDWVEAHSDDLNDNQKLRLYILQCDGTEPDSVTITTGSTNKSAGFVIHVRGGFDSDVEGTAWDFEATDSGYGTTPDPPSITPTWGSAENLYIPVFYAAGHAPSVDTYPTGYSTEQNEATSRVTVGMAAKTATSTTEDPDNFVLSGSNNNRAGVLAIRPAASVIAGAGVATGTGTAYDTTITPPTVEASAEVASGVGTAYFVRTKEQQVDADLVVEWDLDNDGDFSESEEDITARVMSGSMVRGRSYPSQVTGQSTPGEMRLVVKNDDDAFSYFNESSVLNTSPFSLETGRLIRIRTNESTPTDPAELARALFGGSGPIATADTGETWTTQTTAGFSELGGELIPDGPPVAASSGGEEDPDSFTWTNTENHTAVTAAIRAADGETITLRSSSELQLTGNATSHDITLPGTIEADDLIVTAVATQDASDPGAPATPSGYTALASIAPDSSFRPRVSIFYKIADGTEDSTNVTFDWSPTSLDCHAVALVYDGVDTSVPWDVGAFGNDSQGTDSVDPVAVTPNDSGSRVVVFLAGNDSPSTTTPTVSTGYTKEIDQTPDEKAFIVFAKTVDFGDPGTEHIATLPAGQNNYYAQGITGFRDTINEQGLVFDWTDSDNHGRVYLGDKELKVDEIVSGTTTNLLTVTVENRDKVTIGFAKNGSSVRAYLDGVGQTTVTTTLTATDDVGPYVKWFSQRAPTFDEFYVWTRTRAVQSWDSVDQSGVLGTMRVTKVEPTVDDGHRKIAHITAQGDLKLLDRPTDAPSSVGPAGDESVGVTAGLMIGNTLGKVGAIHPPHEIAAGDVTLGSVGFDRQRAIGLVRRFEETEVGFISEARDGGIKFEDRSHRDGSAVTATFTDDTANVLGHGYRSARLRDWQGDLINDVTSEVSPSLPQVTFFQNSGSSASGDVDIEHTVPSAAEPGDLLLVFITSSVQTDGTFWLNPAGWTSLRPLQDELGQRVYAKRLEAGDPGSSVKWYDDSTTGGAYFAMMALVTNWYGVIESGVSITEHTGFGSPHTTAKANAGDNDPPVMFTPWPIGPTLFIAFRAGMTGTSPGRVVSSATDDLAPDGFSNLFSANNGTSAGDGDDIGHQWATRLRTEQVVNPSPFGGEFANFNLVETCTVAVRGFAGDPPPSTGGDPVRDSDRDSQVSRGAVLAHPNPGVLFKDSTDAATYNNLILQRFGVDRPIVSFSFDATRDDLLRTQAANGDLSDRIRVDADGAAGFGFDQEFFIESIAHEFGDGMKRWSTTYDCSPATDAGPGAD